MFEFKMADFIPYKNKLIVFSISYDKFYTRQKKTALKSLRTGITFFFFNLKAKDIVKLCL